MSHVPVAASTPSSAARGGQNDAGNSPDIRRRPNLRRFCLKTKMCPLILRGACDRGESCRFAHHPSQIQVAPDLSRTKLCPKLLRTGCCPRRGACRFAHSEAELRRVDQFDEEEWLTLDVPREAQEVPTCHDVDERAADQLPCETTQATLEISAASSRVDALTADDLPHGGRQVAKDSVSDSTSAPFNLLAAGKGTAKAELAFSALQQQRQATAENSLPNLLGPPRNIQLATRGAADLLAKGMKPDAKESAPAVSAAADSTSSNPSATPSRLCAVESFPANLVADDTSFDTTRSEPVSPPQPLLARSSRDTQQVTSCLRIAAASGAMTLEEMVFGLSKIYSAIFRSRPGVERRVGVTPRVLALVVAEEAWADADLCKDSRMTFDEFTRWCSARHSKGPLVLPRKSATPCGDEVANFECRSPQGSEVWSRRSTEVGMSSPWSMHSSDLPSAPASNCGPSATWSPAPMESPQGPKKSQVDDRSVQHQR